jgi:BirA family biotin operon repressor/biotin-[acetyl-CoA-carboxylase] ligase
VYAQDLLSKSLPIEGTVITTFNQTAGRGQIGSKWVSEANKNISLSIILYPHFLAPKEQFILHTVSSLAVSDLITKYLEDSVKVKWPNDIYIKDRKTSGILTQNSISSAKINYSIIGIGLNVNQTDFPPNIPNPTSLKLATQKDFDLETLVSELCLCVEHRYLQLKSGQQNSLKNTYLERLYRLEEPSWFQRADGSKFYGTIKGVNPMGKLMIELNGHLEYFQIKEIRFLN